MTLVPHTLVKGCGLVFKNFGITTLACVLFLVTTLSIRGQETKPDAGAKLGSSYSVGEFDSVNTTNGNLMLSFPLGSTPAGRGQAAAGMGLYYNSKLYSTRVTKIRDERYSCNWEDDGPENCAYYYKTSLEQNPKGGWTYGSGYYLEFENRLNSYDMGSMPSCRSYGPPNSLWEEMTYVNKLRVIFPDGSAHEMLPQGYSDSSTMQDKFYRVRFDGVLENCGGSQTRTGAAVTYYSDDGSYLRLAFSYDGDTDGNNNTWTLYFPDGSKVTSGLYSSGAAYRVYDRNGNYVEGLTDQFGRGVTSSTDSYGDHFTVKGVAGQDITWTVKWKDIYAKKTYRSCASTCPSYEQRSNLDMIFSVVDTITEPSQMGGRTYVFSYNAHPFPTYPPGESNGWGEVSEVLLPTRSTGTTDARITYEYDMDGVDGPDDELPSDISSILDNFPDTKTVYHDGETDVWHYSTGGTAGSTTEPDGGVTNNYFFNNHPSYPSWKDGLTYKTEFPNGTKIEKVWAQNTPQSACGSSHLYFACNPYVKAEYTSIQSGSTFTYTAAKLFTYDKNGNVTEVDEYDWIPYSTITRTSGMPDDTQSGISSYLKRKTVTTYYNDTPAASSSTYSDADSYWLGSSKRLLRLPSSVEVQDASSTPKSRSEMTYDYTDYSGSNTVGGNVTATKSWDSFKGGSSQSYSNPLTSTNSISTSATYNSYGMPTQTTDANSVQTTITYGGIVGPSTTYYDLYPTQTIVASNYSAVALTSSATYDFYTGLVTTATDNDNSLSTVMEYDDLGRTTKVKSAYGTGLEAWTQTTYSDTNRYVIVKSDLASVGDAKKVVTTFFDQLDRPRLSKTLEDASTQSATNETDGIKVEKKYKISSGYTYQITSNPYRASSSSGASGEETMGWTRSKTGATGLHSEVETFSGSGMPAPWGSNTTSTGVVQTDIDANTTTITDQASKVRRSLVNGLGQTIRVDEPNSSNALGTVSSPNQATNYYYDVLNKLIRVNQGSQNRYFMYSSLGRTLRVYQPEQEVNTSLNTSGNPDNNSWTMGMTYDSNGNVLTTTDPKGTTITNTYDALNRPLTRSYSDSTPTVTNTYDESTIARSRGKLTKVSSSVSETRYTGFDYLNRLTETKQITGGNTYTTGYAYNLSALTQTTYPSGRTVSMSYDADGDISSITGVPYGGSSKTYANNFSYSADKKIKQLKLGNNLWETAAFNPRLQVTEFDLGTTQGGYDVWKDNYEYGELGSGSSVDGTKNAGNVAKQTVTFSGLSYPFIQTYQYDYLDRITEAKETVNGSQKWIQDWGYDRYGNRSSFTQNILGTTTVSNPSIDTSSNRYSSSQGYSFDKNGNVTADPMSSGRTFVFDGDNKQTQVKDSSNNVIGTYYYDGEGHRVKKVTSAETTTFVYASGQLLEERNSSNTVTTSYLYAGAQLLATETSSDTNYTATDNLGSPRVITNGSGSVVARRDFLPFGEELFADGTYRKTTDGYTTTGSDPVRQRFTGYQRDLETSLDFAEARYYDNTHARFTAVDPLLASGKSANPQTFNRYVYTMNRPLTLNDPTGLQAGASTDNSIFDRVYTAVNRITGAFIDSVRERTQFLLAAGTNLSSLDQANFQRIQNRIGAANGDPSSAATLNRHFLGNIGESSDGIVQSVTDTVQTTNTISNVSLTIQDVLLMLPTPSGSKIPFKSFNEEASVDLSGGAQSSANAAKLYNQLLGDEANSVFSTNGQLAQSVINKSTPIIEGNELGATTAAKLTSDGSKISDWAKFSSPTFKTPAGPAQVHFYQNKVTGIVNYESDYKIIFNAGFPTSVLKP